jgi:hypothetical protein
MRCHASAVSSARYPVLIVGVLERMAGIRIDLQVGALAGLLQRRFKFLDVLRAQSPDLLPPKSPRMAAWMFWIAAGSVAR